MIIPEAWLELEGLSLSNIVPGFAHSLGASGRSNPVGDCKDI